MTGDRSQGIAGSIALTHRTATGLLLLACACGSGAERDRASGGSGPVSAEDVQRFVQVYRELSPADTSCQSLRDYFAKATPGLTAYAAKFDVGVPELCAAVHKMPERYAAIEATLPALDSASRKIQALFVRFRDLYPEGRTPGVYFLVGNGISAGTTTRGGNPLILISLERNGSTAGLVPTVAHEFVHTQQHFSRLGALTGGPRPLRGTLLRQSIMEGSANLIAELVTGVVAHDSFGEAHEAELWLEFLRDRHSRDYSQWLWNGRDPKRPADRPADLGYFMGYRIAKSYYDRAPDKAGAIRAILTIQDFDRFLALSGYQGKEPVSPQ